ncbi:NADH:flavin oxidoreductase/NADH oxidase [Teichococcus oryzae]|uniref:NADH:flavin oxidoreductase/NADH oxidase n=1 Tax=Teichococcus oryzae TaxID=1608942 RepID=A0A5B2TAV0_9PROT|nr:NADH:flavin oxidoreductase/NADH oxidase [Pseudoroseomonas oryzae]KAA2211657.1 NADH:flavin oxidoreductase/NADH oxidase [Pseudoroseomonas oryzae]
MTDLFEPLTLRGVTLRNRIGVAPMCQYSCAPDGKATEWHLGHLQSRAVGGSALVIAEATAVVPEGRITPQDLGLWEEGQAAGHARLARAVAAAGAVPGIQLAHAGRKASAAAPWVGGLAREHGWTPVAPSAVAFPDMHQPRALDEEGIAGVIAAFAATAKRAIGAGYRFIEIHAAHGYLLHQFLSPLANHRNDGWGGDFNGRTRLTREVVSAVRAAIPDEVPLAIRISHTDWAEGGWNTEESVELARQVKALGVDLVDVSSGGLVPARIPLGPGYQVPGAAAVREGAGLPVAAVGLITEPVQAQAILNEGKADLILLARELLRDPYWPLRAAAALGRTAALPTPPQYDRAWSALGETRIAAAIAEPAPAL